MATATTSSFVATRDDVIQRALRLCGAIGQLETPDAGAVTEANMALNMLIKEWQGDGMQLWKITTINFPVVAATSTYNIGVGSTINQEAPLKVIQAYARVGTADTPFTLFTKQEYDMYSSKTIAGSPTQMFYKTPGATIGAMVGTIYLLPVPTATDVSNGMNIYMTGVFPLKDFTASTDNPDLPSYYYNALCWGLADQLSTEYGVPLSERGFIQSKAERHLEKAKSFDIEEGSLYLQPGSEGE
jgi:hypothetical protein